MISALLFGSSGPVPNQVGYVVLCSYARHFTLTVPLSTQVHKWVPAKLIRDTSAMD